MHATMDCDICVFHSWHTRMKIYLETIFQQVLNKSGMQFFIEQSELYREMLELEIE